MDFFDQRILTTLKDSKPKDFTTILSEAGFSHNTLQQHLNQLTTRGLVVKEKATGKNFGRPRFTYRVPSKTAKQVNSAANDPQVELVAIAFRRLRHVCRFEKGGRCKETKKDCSPQVCPQILK